jgi:hypothetical protein
VFEGGRAPIVVVLLDCCGQLRPTICHTHGFWINFYLWELLGFWLFLLLNVIYLLLLFGFFHSYLFFCRFPLFLVYLRILRWPPSPLLWCRISPLMYAYISICIRPGPIRAL